MPRWRRNHGNIGSKIISDQYQGTVIKTKDGAVVAGRVLGEKDGKLQIATDLLYPDKLTEVAKGDVADSKPSALSPMPEKLIGPLNPDEALDLLARDGVAIDFMRLRGFPFGDDVAAFVESHDVTFVVEQNRDAQLRSLLVLETGVEMAKLESVRYYGGFPMSAHHVIAGVRARLERAA